MLPLAAHHDDWRRIAARCQLAEYLEAVQIRHHQIEHQHIVPAAFHRAQATSTGGDNFNRAAFSEASKIELDHVGDLRVVLGIEHTNHAVAGEEILNRHTLHKL